MNLSPAEIISTFPSLRTIVDAYGLMAKKSLGQNFLLDANIPDKIIRLSLQKQNKTDYAEDFVYEVGPGPGGLTRAVLAHNPKKLTVVEMDSRCISIMEDIKEKIGSRLEIISGDALQQNFAEKDSSPRHIVSNLPYNISVPLLLNWLKQIKAYQSLTLMFQKEVAERITAPTGSKNYGRISVLAQLCCKIDWLMDLNPECFTPPPKIWSAVLLFRTLAERPSPKQIKNIEFLTNLAFSQRRKMIRQSLKQITNLSEKLQKANIDETFRAEQISPEQYLTLACLL